MRREAASTDYYYCSSSTTTMALTGSSLPTCVATRVAHCCGGERFRCDQASLCGAAQYVGQRSVGRALPNQKRESSKVIKAEQGL